MGESLAVLYGVVRDMDASTSCDQRGDGQVSCRDPGCPRCSALQMAVQSLTGPSIVSVVIKDVVQRLPHRVLDDGVTPLDYRSQYFGNFPFSTLDRAYFRDRHSKFFI